MGAIVGYLVVACILVAVVCILVYIIYTSSYNIYKKDVIDMNRRIFDYKEDGWMILINATKKVVGLYHDHHSVSHDKVYIGRSMKDVIDSSDEIRLIIEDFHKLDVDVPRLSYRILYEYQVPFSTPVIIYKK